MLAEQNSDELSSQTRSLITVLVLKLILVFCSLLGGFSIYVLNVTKSDMKNMVRDEILGTTAVYHNNIADIQILEKRLAKIEQSYQNNIATMEVLKYKIESNKKDSEANIIKIVNGEVSTIYAKTISNEVFTKRRISKVKNDLEKHIARLQSDLEKFKLDFEFEGARIPHKNRRRRLHEQRAIPAKR